MQDFKFLLREYFKSDLHLHTIDGSMCARSTVWEWSEFYTKQIDWVECVIVTNHSHPPGLYDSRIMNRKVITNSYEEVVSPKFYSGIEVNITHDGFDLDDEQLKSIPWVMAALNPLATEYREKEINSDPYRIEELYIKSITSGLIDVLAHPTKDINDLKLRRIDWKKIFDICFDAGVLVEINLLINNPNWWLNLLKESKTIISLGSDWHGMYHFRKIRPINMSNSDQILWDKLSTGSRKEFDLLSNDFKKSYNRIFIDNNLPNDFYKYISEEIVKIKEIGIPSNRVLNSGGLEVIDKLIKVPRTMRAEMLKRYV